MLLGGQQRLDKIVQRIEQLAADLNAQQLRLIAAGRVMAALDDRIMLRLTSRSTSRVLRLTNLQNFWPYICVWPRRRCSPSLPPK